MAPQPLGSGRAGSVARSPEARRNVSAAVPRTASPLRNSAPRSTAVRQAPRVPAYQRASGYAKEDRWLDEFSSQLREAPTQKAIESRRVKYDAGTTLAGALIKLLIAALVILALFTWVFGILRIQGNAMRPTAGDGDLVLTSRVIDSLESDDLVIYEEDGKQVLGRVVAQPGDTVEITDDGELKVNGNEQASVTQGSTTKGSSSIVYPITLEEGQYFVLNDDRDDVSDSREYGAVGLNAIQGKVIALLRIREI